METTDTIITVWKQRGHSEFVAALQAAAQALEGFEPKAANVPTLSIEIGKGFRRAASGARAATKDVNAFAAAMQGMRGIRSLRNIGNVTTKVSADMRQLTTALQDVNKNLAGIAGADTSKPARGFRTVRAEADMASRGVAGLGRELLHIAGFAGGAYMVRSALGSIIESTGRLQMAQVGFRKMLDSDSAGQAMVDWSREFAKTTPYTFADTTKGIQQLLAMGVKADNVTRTMRILGDAVQATQGDSQTFGRIVFNLGQIQTMGKVTTRELRDFAMNGIPAFEILREELGLTEKQMERIGDAGISADVGLEALLRGLEKRFGGLMGETMGNLPQQINRLKDNFEELAASIGTNLMPIFTKVIGGATKLTNVLNSLENSGGLVSKGLVLGGVVASWKAVTRMIPGLMQASRARRRLTKTILDDIGAEKDKEKVAKDEEDAIGKGTKTIGRSAAARKNLLDVIRDNIRAIRLGGGQAWTLGGFRMTSPFAGAFGGRGIMGGIGARGSAAVMGHMTRFGAGISGGLGLAAGMQAHGSYKTLGASDGQAFAAAAATGIGAGLASMFVPGGAIAVAAGTAIAWGINRYVNEPMERAAEGIISDEEVKKLSEMSQREQAAWYRQRAKQAKEEGDMANARMFAMTARSRDQRAEAAEREANAAKWREEQREKREKERFDRLVRNPDATFTRNRNDAWEVNLNFPTGRGDVDSRVRNYNSMTPAPAGMY